MRVVVAFLLLLSLNRAGIERAVGLARWPHTDAERARFHARYVTTYHVPQSLAAPAVESIEILTEFRRLELIAEAHEQAHDMWARGGAMQDAEDALKPWRGRVSIVAHVQFGLLTIGAPQVAIAMIGADAPQPLSTKMTPIYVRDALVGGDVEASFASADVGQSIRIVTVRSNGEEIARTTVDFGAID